MTTPLSDTKPAEPVEKLKEWLGQSCVFCPKDSPTEGVKPTANGSHRSLKTSEILLRDPSLEGVIGDHELLFLSACMPHRPELLELMNRLRSERNKTFYQLLEDIRSRLLNPLSRPR